MDLNAFAKAVGEHDPVCVVGAGTRGGPPSGRPVRAPGGIAEYQPEEMTVRCGAGTPVAELAEALAAHGQEAALPAGGTVGGALAVGRSDILRLRRGPVREVLLQARFVGASGDVVKAGGPTVKNVSGYDLCRLLVGSWGTLGFLGEVIFRTRPVPAARVWVGGEADPFALLARLYRPQSVLWDGASVWVCLAGHPADVAEQAQLAELPEVEGPPPLPAGGRASMAPSELRDLPSAGLGPFVAEVGVGVVHLDEPVSRPAPAAALVVLHRRIKSLFDPAGRLNPGVDPLLA